MAAALEINCGRQKGAGENRDVCGSTDHQVQAKPDWPRRLDSIEAGPLYFADRPGSRRFREQNRQSRVSAVSDSTRCLIVIARTK